MNSNYPPALTTETIDKIRSLYGEPEIPKCSICGGDLSIQRVGGGGPTIWACSGIIDDPTGERNWIYAEGRSCADEHYDRSRWSDYRRGGDSNVIALVNAYQDQLKAEHPTQLAFSVPDGWKLVPIEPTCPMIDAAIDFHEGEAFLPASLYKAMIAAAPTSGGGDGDKG